MRYNLTARSKLFLSHKWISLEELRHTLRLIAYKNMHNNDNRREAQNLLNMLEKEPLPFNEYKRFPNEMMVDLDHLYSLQRLWVIHQALRRDDSNTLYPDGPIKLLVQMKEFNELLAMCDMNNLHPDDHYMFGIYTRTNFESLTGLKWIWFLLYIIWTREIYSNII